MFLTILLIVAATMLYLNVGFFIGHLHWIVRREVYSGEKYIFSELDGHYKHLIWWKILWPLAEWKSIINDDFVINKFNKEQHYNMTMSILGPIKMIYLLAVWIILLSYAGLVEKTLKTIFRLLRRLLYELMTSITWPAAKILKINS
jgi:hypothetical protein